MVRKIELKIVQLTATGAIMQDILPIRLLRGIKRTLQVVIKLN